MNLVQELHLGLQILLKDCSKPEIVEPLPSLLGLQNCPAPIFQPLPGALPSQGGPTGGPAGWELDSEDEAAAALEEAGDSAAELDSHHRSAPSQGEPFSRPMYLTASRLYSICWYGFPSQACERWLTLLLHCSGRACHACASDLIKIDGSKAC